MTNVCGKIVYQTVKIMVITMENTLKAKIAVEELQQLYPDACCSLKCFSPLEILIAVRLSAQCTDVRVNAVTPVLFRKFTSLEDFANADPDEIAGIIRSCGFFRIKALDIVNICKKIISDFDGKIPNNIDDLTSLPGVGRKTANLILGLVYNMPGIVVDTHVLRITHRMGFHNEKDPRKVEKIMMEIIPPEVSQKFCHQMISHGKNTCTARNPKCKTCSLRRACDRFESTAIHL